jgi:hypothetical protein
MPTDETISAYGGCCTSAHDRAAGRVMDNVDILWLTRGVSFGHAMRDTAVLSALQLARPELQIHFVSYANGVACLR